MVRRGRELTLVEHARPTGPGDADLSLVVRARLRRPLHRERLELEAWLVTHPAWRARLQEEGSGVRWDLARQARGIAFTWGIRARSTGRPRASSPASRLSSTWPTPSIQGVNDRPRSTPRRGCRSGREAIGWSRARDDVEGSSPRRPGDDRRRVERERRRCPSLDSRSSPCRHNRAGRRRFGSAATDTRSDVFRHRAVRRRARLGQQAPDRSRSLTRSREYEDGARAPHGSGQAGPSYTA